MNVRRQPLSLFALAVLLASTVLASKVDAQVTIWQGSISEDQIKNGPEPDGSTDSTATGNYDIRYDAGSRYLSYDVRWNGLQHLLSAIHVHGPADAANSSMSHLWDIFLGEPDVIAAGVERTTGRTVANRPWLEQMQIGAPSFLPDDTLTHMFADMGYVNVHSLGFPMGEIRGNLLTVATAAGMSKDDQKCWGQLSKGYESLLKAQAKQVDYCLKNGAAADLVAWAGAISEDQIKNGPEVDGSTDSTATGNFRIVYNTKRDDFSYEIEWNGLLNDLTKLHIHCPADATMSTPDHCVDIFNDPSEVTPSPDPVTGGVDVDTTFEDQLAVGAPSFTKDVALGHMMNELAYINVHTVGFPMGEIRGNLVLSDAVEACLLADSQGKVAKAVEKLNVTIADKCDGTLPPFGVEAPDFVTAASQAAQDASIGMTHALFGPNVDAALADSTGDKVTSKCQTGTMKKAGKCGSTIAKAFTSCAIGGLKGKKSVTVVDEDSLAACIGKDAKGKIAKACGAEDGTLGKFVAKKCTGDLAAIFPGPGVADVASLTAAVETSYKCEACKATNAAYALSEDCDFADNGLLDTSCN
jgi:hypothetical protein